MTDAILTTLLQNQLDHISKQMGWVMERTARSPIFSESHDFSCFIADASGRLISVADGIPIHTGGGGFAVDAVLRDYGADGGIVPGDVFILSDPYEAGGNHLPDWTIIRPVFVDGVLLAFTCNRAHQSDIGGGAAGTYNAAATEIFHEGIRLPVMKLIGAGQVRDDVWRLLKLNSRTPHLLDGDLRAMIGSTKVGERRIQTLTEEFKLDVVAGCFDAILDHAEACMRRALLALPDGLYEGEDSSDNDCFQTVDVLVRVAVTVKGDEVKIDFTGSAPQIAGFKNSSVANTHSAVYVALLSYFGVTIPRNSGAFRPVEIIAPRGSVVNANYPAPMTANTGHPAIEIINAIWKALAKAAPDLACAGWGKGSSCVSSGKNAAGETYVMYHMHAYPAAGAVRGRDGFPSIGGVISLGGMRIPNVEVFERKYPVRIHRQEMRCDAAGAGEYRGGTGIDYEVSVSSRASYSFRGEGSFTPSGFGISGGGTGKKADVVVSTHAGAEIAAPQYGVMELPPTRISVSSAAGGGWGNPLRRQVDLVFRDVRDGVVSTTAAREVYGVVCTSDGIDYVATEALRHELAGRQPEN
ncbi:Acetophenone carboxylase delta subunit [Ensifer psoraleae]|uniref:hydantoinase B/oxoprolinase family protein n=1 Tax=Sinorhizobium psoraleae TaxID=520838 RepID=UPI001567FDFE|nr:hydantoinase B/oxoprolinase family protein [Sinorhizobium psoraleae]NRP75636.1 Acetophenone carboxylase delta subunit [Sinorhizobium psoraleae]